MYVECLITWLALLGRAHKKRITKSEKKRFIETIWINQKDILYVEKDTKKIMFVNYT